MCLVKGHRSLWGHCPSYHIIPHALTRGASYWVPLMTWCYCNFFSLVSFFFHFFLCFFLLLHFSCLMFMFFCSIFHCFFFFFNSSLLCFQVCLSFISPFLAFTLFFFTFLSLFWSILFGGPGGSDLMTYDSTQGNFFSWTVICSCIPCLLIICFCISISVCWFIY